jgi:hypothetical protein
VGKFEVNFLFHHDPRSSLRRKVHPSRPFMQSWKAWQYFDLVICSIHDSSKAHVKNLHLDDVERIAVGAFRMASPSSVPDLHKDDLDHGHGVPA